MTGKLARGVKTSEFWLHVLSLVAMGAAMIAKVSPQTLAAFGIPAGLINGAYSVSRGWQKAAVAANTPADPATTLGNLKATVEGLDPAVFNEIRDGIAALAAKPPATLLLQATQAPAAAPTAPAAPVAPAAAVVTP